MWTCTTRGFNTATAAFSHVVDSFASSQANVGRLLTTLSDSRRLLTSRSEHLKEYWTQVQVLTHIQHTLNKLSYIHSIPDHLDTLTAANLHLHSTVLLTHTLHLLSEEDLREVEGCIDLRDLLLSRKSNTSDLLHDRVREAIYQPPALRASAKVTDDTSHEDSADPSHSRLGKEEPSLTAPNRPPPPSTPTSTSNDSGGQKARPAPAPATATATLNFLLTSPFSPFAPPAAAAPVDPMGGAYHPSLAPLLVEERSPAFLAHPLSSTSRLLSLLVAALDHLNALPAAKTQITRRVRGEVTGIIDREKAAIRERMKGRSSRRRVAQSPSGASTNSASISRLQRVSADDGDRLSLFLSRLFPALTTVLRHLSDCIQLINSRTALRQEQSSKEQAAAAQGKKVVKGKATVERDDPRWSLEAVWETVQIEVQVALQDVLFSAAGGPSQSLKLSTSTSKKATSGDQHLELTFSFDDSNAPSIARMSRGKEEKTAYERQLEKKAAQAAQKAELLSIVTPSPYLVTVMYRPVLAFTEQVSAIVYPRGNTSTPPPSSQLQGFLSLFITSSFLPRLQADVNIEVDSIFNDSHAFDAVEAPLAITRGFGPIASARAVGTRALSSAAFAGSGAPPLRLRCVLAAAALLDALLADVASLPHTTGEYVELMEAVVGRVVRACEDRYGEACKGVYSATRLLNVQVRQVMEDEPAYTRLILQQKAMADTATNGEGQAQAVSAELNASHPLYGPFFSPDFTLRAEQLLTDPRALTDVCLIAESAEWLADHLYHHCQHSMAALHSQQQTAAAHSTGKRRVKGATKGKSSTKQRSRPASTPSTATSAPGLPLPSFRLEEAQAAEEMSRLSSLPRSPLLDATIELCEGLLPLCESLVSVSTRCLLTLRLELQCHLYYSLSSMRYSTYALPTKPSEPELFILQLASSLSLIDDHCTRLMSQGTRVYLQAGLISLVAALMIAMVAQLQDRRMTRDGVHQLHVDLFALHQLLIGLRVGGGGGGGGEEEGAEGEAFDRAVYYLDLLLLSEEELLSGEHTQQFSRDNIRAIQTLTRTPLRDHLTHTPV